MTRAKGKLAFTAAVLSGVALLCWLVMDPRQRGPGVQVEDPARGTEPAAAPATSQPDPAASRVAAALPEAAASRTAASRAAPAFGALRVRVVWAQDQTPAPDIHVRVLERRPANAAALAPVGVTDERGLVLLPSVWAGPALVVLDRGAAARATVEPETQTELTIEVPAGVDARGIVVDAADVPVPGAEIWLVGFEGLGFCVARAGADGRFLVRSVGWAQFLGARAPGHAPSRTQQLQAFAGGKVDIRLVLPARGGEIEGTVLDPLDQPVAGARLIAGAPRGVQGDQSAVSLARVRSDARGRFRVVGLAPGATAVYVRAEGFAPWRGRLEVVAGAQHPLEVRLTRGATLAGSVSTSDRQPVARAEITIGPGHTELGSMARTAADGAFRLEHVEPGEIEVGIDSDEHGRATRTVVAVEGQETRLDFVLPPLLSIRLRVVDEAGQALAGWYASLMDQAYSGKEFDHGSGRTDAEGRIVFGSMHDRPHRISLSAPKAAARSVELENVHPSSEERLVRIPAASLPSARVIGSIVDPEDRPVDGTMVSALLTGGGGTGIRKVDPQTGRFELGPCPPGEWRLSVTVPNHPRLMLGPRQLAAHETWDVGIVRVLPPGTLQVRVERAPGAGAEAEFKTGVRGESGEIHCEFERRGELLTSAPLNPAKYLLRIGGPALASRMVPFTIEPGRRAELGVRLEPGRPRLVRVLESSPDPKVASVSLTVRDAAGQLIYDGFISRQPDKPHELTLGLAPGRYAVAVASRTGRRAVGELVVTDEPVAEPLVLVLRE